ncbi:MAG: type III polyketide synthase [Mesorhizobium sp.]|nr:type III polyketide synthase [Mesorhizobium sp.]
MKTAKLLSVATAVPPHVLHQHEVAEAAATVFARRTPDFQRLRSVYENAGISRRYGVRPMSWYLEDRGWAERSAVYCEGATELFVDAARKALSKANLEAHQIHTVVTVSSTGISTPSLEARAAKALGLFSSVRRVPIFGLGCAGGVTGLAIASRLAVASPEKAVLLVAVETCTLAFRLDKPDPANLVATALFGDGAAACVLKAGDEGLAEILGSGEHMWPDTLNIMGWRVDPEGFGVIFDRSIPPFARDHLADAFAAMLEDSGCGGEPIDRVLCHPGGAKVIEAIEQALALPADMLDHERSVLRDYGNMSAPTALFVLASALASGLPDRSALMALGPGFTASSIFLARQ